MESHKKELNIAAIIPARGGSKGILNKNLIPICGHPLVTWSIHQANSSKKVSSVWVTSDDEKILQISKQYGSKIINRPLELAMDTSSSESAWIHAIEYLSNQNIFPDVIVGMQATSPIRDSEDIDIAIDVFLRNNYDSLLTVNEIEDYFTCSIDQESNLCPLNHDMNNRKPRQQISKTYLENGSFYIFKPKLIKKFNNRLYGKVGMHLMDKHKSYQIDNTEDLKICTAIMKEYDMKQ